VRDLHVAVDLGAGSGRAFAGQVAADSVVLEEVHRFHYAPRRLDGRLRWDWARLTEGVQDGLRNAGAWASASGGGRIRSAGVDSWAVDYGLLDERGRLLEEPVSYRDERTDGAMDAVFARVPRAEIFARTGIQLLELNTLFQLQAHVQAGLPRAAARLLMIPDLCHHLLCGSETSERTNATTTQLLGAASGAWDDELFARLDLPRRLMPDIVTAGTRLGVLLPEWRARLGLGAIDVVAPATHDTASAVAGTPLAPGWAYVSSGTWSLIGVELDRPLRGPGVARANFTNEGGVGGTVRFLKNVMGLWILESCRREWGVDDAGARAAQLARVAEVRDFVGFVSPDDERFFRPASMVEELKAALRESGQDAPDDPVRLSKVILDSLAVRYAAVVDAVEALTGRAVPGIHIVGGGSRNAYLNQATANACGRPVLAGPVEATAIGNLLVQSMAGGGLASLAEGRAAVARALPPARFLPRDQEAWARARARHAELNP
jgi:rhamnulokinase